MDQLDVTRVREISGKDGISSSFALIKMGEEYGELCAAHLCLKDSQNKSKSSSPNVLEEGVDMILCGLDYLYKEGATTEQINEMIIKKATKWASKFGL